MTGPHDSVIGVEAEDAIRRMRTGLPVRFQTAQGGVRVEGVVIDCDSESSKARRSSRCASRFPDPARECSRSQSRTKGEPGR